MGRDIDNLVDSWSNEDNLFEPSSTYVETDPAKKIHRIEGEPMTGSQIAHHVLMAAGLTPVIGNIADAADAFLYAVEGEWGDAAISGASMVPIAGQFVAVGKVLKIARKTEGTTKIYRGVDKWHRGKMVKNGNFVGGGGPAVGARRYDMFKTIPPKGSMYGSSSFDFANEYAHININNYKHQLRFLKSNNMAPLKQKELTTLINKGPGPVLEFELPNSWLKKNSIKSKGDISVGRQVPSKTVETPLYKKTDIEAPTYAFPNGIPKEFLIKVHK